MITLVAALLVLPQAVQPPSPNHRARTAAACYREETTSRGTKFQVYLGDRACVAFAPPRLFEGLYLNAFEGQRFVEGARVRSEVPRSPDGAVWFSTDNKTERSTTATCPPQHLCRIKFEGRAARDMNRSPLEGYGHFGMSAGLVLADRILRVEDLGPLSISSGNPR